MMSLVDLKKIFNNASWRSMKRSIAPDIKPRNNNLNSLTEKLQHGTGVLLPSSVLKLLNRMKKNAGGCKRGWRITQPQGMHSVIG